MKTLTVTFDKKVKFYVDVDDAKEAEARRMLGYPSDAAKAKELVAVTKLLEKRYQVAPPTAVEWDIEITLMGQKRPVDIKTLYPDYSPEPVPSNEVLAALLMKVDSEVRKEKGQTACCLFDLSYLHPETAETLEGMILQKHTMAMTLRYEQSPGTGILVNGK